MPTIIVACLLGFFKTGDFPVFVESDSHNCSLARPDHYAFGGRLFRHRRLMPASFQPLYHECNLMKLNLEPAPVQSKPPEEQLTKRPSNPSPNALPAPEGQGSAVPPESISWPTGVEWDKVSTKERTTIGGTVVTKSQGLQYIEGLPNGRGDHIPDDGRWLRVTAIGAPAETNTLAEDLQKDPKLLPFKNKYVLQLYDPMDAKTAWAVDRAGFVTEGHPSIYVQESSGKTLARLDHYPGPAGMATVLSASLRKVDPSYDPKKDSDPTKPLNLPLPAVVLGGCLLLLLLFGKRAGG
jgi:hypothetical protein